MNAGDVGASGREKNPPGTPSATTTQRAQRSLASTLLGVLLGSAWLAAPAGAASARMTRAELSPPTLPQSRGVCPRFDRDWVEVHPGSLYSPRSVRVWRSPQAQERPGPLVIFWHGMRRRPDQAQQALGAELARIEAQGGMVLAPSADPEAGIFPWHLVAGRRQDDLRVADELVACAVEQGLVDPTRIHVLGMSAGGVMSAEMSYRRSSYVASAVAFSGGLIRPVSKAFATASMAPMMLLHGGRQDKAIVSFARASRFTAQTAHAHRSQALVCDHGKGHHLPPDMGPLVARFFREHAYGQEAMLEVPAQQEALSCQSERSSLQEGNVAPPRLGRLLGPRRAKHRPPPRQRWRRVFGKIRLRLKPTRKRRG